MHARIRVFARLVAFLLPLSLALLLVWWGQGARTVVRASWNDYLHPVTVPDVPALERLFAELDYPWPPQPGRSVPRIAVEPLPADYEQVGDIQVRKSLFFRVLLPMVLAENARILQQRELLEEIYQAGASVPDSPPGRVLRQLMDEYRVAGNPADAGVRAELLRRVDMVPVALVLAQAANESGWGTSRFTRLGNNLFGVWTYREDAGIVPAERGEGETHAVRVFSSLRASVRSHLRNLNIGHAYDELRRLRERIRAEGGTLDSLMLADGLVRYSTRGEDYIGEIQAIIRSNHLRAVRAVDLRDGDLRPAARPVESTSEVPAGPRGG
jgi:Bax protein